MFKYDPQRSLISNEFLKYSIIENSCRICIFYWDISHHTCQLR